MSTLLQSIGAGETIKWFIPSEQLKGKKNVTKHDQ